MDNNSDNGLMQGGLSSSYKKLIEEKKLIERTYSSDGMALIQITSTSFNINKAIQVDAVCQVISTMIFVWWKLTNCIVQLGIS